MRLENLNIDLDNTFRCGQNFRWRRCEDGSWLGNVDGRAVRAAAQNGGLTLIGAKAEDEAFWRNYFDADSDYETLLSDLLAPGAVTLSSLLRTMGGIRPKSLIEMSDFPFLSRRQSESN